MSGDDGNDREKIRRYLGYAEELRVLSERMVNADAKALVLSVIADYLHMAQLLEEQLTHK